MTRLASGSLAAPQLPAVFVAIGRAALAGLLAAGWLLATRAPWPRAAQWRQLALTALGVVFGFPLFLGLAVQRVDAAHAAVVSGLLPIATAVIGALLMRQRPSAGFWACALAGTALVLGFAVWQGGARLQAADGLLLLAVVWGGFGYVMGARLSAPQGDGSAPMPPQQVISWVLVLCLPVTAAGGAGHLAGGAGAGGGLGRLSLCQRVLGVAGLLRLVPRAATGWHAAGQPDPAAAAVPVDAAGGAAAGRAAGAADRGLCAGGDGHGVPVTAHGRGAAPDLKEP